MKGSEKQLQPVSYETARNSSATVRRNTKDVKVLISPDMSLDMIDSTKGRRGGLNSLGYNTSIEGLGIPKEYGAEDVMTMENGLRNINKADAVLLVGCDPRKEAPLVNVKLREGFLRGTRKVYSVGPCGDLTFPVETRGKTLAPLANIEKEKHPF